MNTKPMNRRHARALRRNRLALALVGVMLMPMPVLARPPSSDPMSDVGIPQIAINGGKIPGSTVTGPIPMPSPVTPTATIPAGSCPQCLPQNGTVVSGTVTTNYDTVGGIHPGTIVTDDEMVITQTSQGAIINWNSFDVAALYTVTFIQPNASSVLLNRVMSTFGASTIDGNLNSNGNVFIINPFGVTFGAGSQVNVGSLLASTINISDADFLTGVGTGHYTFSTAATAASTVINAGSITTADKGTVALIGSYVGNTGTITANHGSVLFGATQTVTLDYFGDGLTTITVAGNGMNKLACAAACEGGIASSGTISALGGYVDMRTNTMDGLPTVAGGLNVTPANGGRIWITGRVNAYTDGARRGSITLDAGLGNVDLGGTAGQAGVLGANALNPGEQAGTVSIRGTQLFQNGCELVGGVCPGNLDSSGIINAYALGTGGIGGDVFIDVDRYFNFNYIQAVGMAQGGNITINAGLAEIYSLIATYAMEAGGDGGSIAINADTLTFYRGLFAPIPYPSPSPNYMAHSALLTIGGAGGDGGNVSLNVIDALLVIDNGGYVPPDPDYAPIINTRGFNGGQIDITTSAFNLPVGQLFDASGLGANGNGGNINLFADSLTLGGSLVATGGVADVNGNGGLWGFVTTSATHDMLVADSALVKSGVWLIEAPTVFITLPGGTPSGGGATIEQGALSGSLGLGTNIDVFANGLGAGTGWLQIDNGVAITHTAPTIGQSLNLRANNGLFGSGFSIISTAGTLDIYLTGNANGLNTGDGELALDNFTLESTGGNIVLFGGSTGTGVSLSSGAINSAGGQVIISGNAADTGVYMSYTTVDSGGGNITINGDSTGYGEYAVTMYGSSLYAGAGNISIHGADVNGTGISVAGAGATISTTTGSINLNSTGYYYGLQIDGGVITTTSGDITLEGTAAGTSAVAGVLVTGAGLTTHGGNVSVTGTTTSGVGVQLGDGSTPFAIQTYGGNVVVTGDGATMGVNFSLASIDAGAGAITVDGDATAGSGVYLYYGDLTTTSGAITVTGDGTTDGVALVQSSITTATGNLNLNGAATSATAALGVYLYQSSVTAAGGDIAINGTSTGSAGVGVGFTSLQNTTGDILITGDSTAGGGVFIGEGASIYTTSGTIAMIGQGALIGLSIEADSFSTNSGDITLDGTVTTAGGDVGVLLYGDGITTHGGTITITGNSAGGSGVQLGDGSTTFTLSTYGGNIQISGTGVGSGVSAQDVSILSAGGDVAVVGTADGDGVLFDNTLISSLNGDVLVQGTGTNGIGVGLRNGSDIGTTGGSVQVVGVGFTTGLQITDSGVSSDGGHLDLRGRGTSATSSGLVLDGTSFLYTVGGGIELSGEGGSGAGLAIGAGVDVHGGSGVVEIRAANDGSSDALRIDGTISSTLGVNLRPGGVDTAGNAYDRVNDDIVLGGTTGFALTDAELDRITAPDLVIGSSTHAGAIHVINSMTHAGNLTLQNQGGTGGIDLQASLDVGNFNLALATGGDIIQAATGAITAHSLLAQAGGDVLLDAAPNAIADTTLAGSAGGDFSFINQGALSVGTVSVGGFNAATGTFTSLSQNGVTAGGSVFIQTLAGNFTLNGNISGTTIELVMPGTFQNPGSHTLTASNGWRIWASTWVGENRGGLDGSSGLPNLYGCTFGTGCAATQPAAGNNYFLYQQQPTAVVTADDLSREYGLADPTFTYSVSGLILGDDAASVITGLLSTLATMGSDVGQYAIGGSFLSPAGYLVNFLPGTLTITPATLYFTADSFIRYFGSDNPLFTGTVTGFRNGDTLLSVFGNGLVWWSPAGPFSPVGFYEIFGGTTAKNYVFSQAPGNATALQILPVPQASSIPVEFISGTVDTYVYDTNIGRAPVCAINSSMDAQSLASTGDTLANEWTKVRTRPNLTNCFDDNRESGCSSF